MKLTVRGQGIVAGLILAIITVFAHQSADKPHEMKGGEPVVIEQSTEEPTGWLPSGAIPWMNQVDQCLTQCDNGI
jgi:hypothetical protein